MGPLPLPPHQYYDSDWRRDTDGGLPGAYLTEGGKWAGRGGRAATRCGLGWADKRPGTGPFVHAKPSACPPSSLAGVHFVAALRGAARAAGWGEAVAVAAVGRGLGAGLPHPDTLTGAIYFGGPALEGQPPQAPAAAAAASFCMTMAAGLGRVALTAVGTHGTAEAARGGLGGVAGRSWRLRWQRAGELEPLEEGFEADDSVAAELQSFARLVRAAAPALPSSVLTAAEAAEAAATDGSDPERRAAEATASGSPPHVPLDALPSTDDAWRVSAVEAIRDLAVVEALLQSAQRGGALTPVSLVAG